MFDPVSREMIGIFGADINLAYIQYLAEQFMEFGHGRYSFIIDSEGIVIAHPESGYIETLTNFKSLTRTIAETDASGNPVFENGTVITREEEFAVSDSYKAAIDKVMNGESGLEIVTKDGETYYMSYTPINLPGYSDSWSVITLQNRAVAMNVIWQLVIPVLLIIALIIAVLLTLIFVFYRSLRNTMTSLEEAKAENENQLLKLNLAVKATKIGLWEMEVI
jgi:methyl-accepting chemotaxis protein